MSPRILIAASLSLLSASLNAQTTPVSGAFVSTLGTDTIAVERYTRSGTKLEGDILYRFPRVRIVHYVADLGNGKFKGMSVATRPVASDPATPPLFSMITLLGDTSASIEVQRNGRPDTTVLAKRSYSGRVAPSVPGIPGAYGLYEQILSYNQPAGADSMVLTMVGPAGGPNATLSMLRRTRDSLVFVSSFNNGWVERVAVDANGRIVGVDATATTVKSVTKRAGNLNFDALAAAWAAQETARGRMGSMSPGDTVKATVGAANVEIVYSRPLKRGRQIWGSVVPWNQTWRTGANAATQLSTSADLMFGTTVVPAGKYTLFSLPTPGGTKLIINSQTGQWGTEYDMARDVARLDMTQTMLTTPVDAFTIAVVPQANAAVLKLSWDNREFSIPFRTK